MRDPVLRQRMERVLNGPFRPDDLLRLFAALRLQSYGMQTVQEIGHFAAHATERDRGISTEMAKGFFDVLRFQGFGIENKHHLDLANLPAGFTRMLSANINRFEIREIAEAAKIQPKTVAHVFKSLLKKLPQNAAGGHGLAKGGSLTTEELAILQFLVSTYRITPAFTDDIVMAEFYQCLSKNGLIDASEQPALENKRQTIVLFVIGVMHRCRILLDKNDFAELHVGLQAGDMLSVVAAADWKLTTLSNIRLAGPIFSTSIDAKDTCESDLFDLLSHNPSNTSSVGIELSHCEKLVILR
jgi:hypothetical protein